LLLFDAYAVLYFLALYGNFLFLWLDVEPITGKFVNFPGQIAADTAYT